MGVMTGDSTAVRSLKIGKGRRGNDYVTVVIIMEMMMVRW